MKHKPRMDSIHPVAMKFEMKNGGLVRKMEAVKAMKRPFELRMLCSNEKPTADIHKENHARSCRKRHCAFRLLNTLFSDEFAKEFGNTGNIATARRLTDKDEFDKSFWTKVQEVFIRSILLKLTDDKPLQGNIGINPLKTKQHDWSKLRDIHRGVEKKMDDRQLQLQKVRHFLCLLQRVRGHLP